MSGLAFAAPLALLALAALPVIWWLNRATPPRPARQLFPPLRLMAGLRRDEETADRTPWWLLVLRLVVAAAVIVGAAGPRLVPSETVTAAGGPLWLLIDNGPTAAPDWADRVTTAGRILDEAEEAGRPVLIAAVADGPDHVAAQTTATEARRRLNALAPRAVFADRAALAARLTEIAGTAAPGEIVLIAEPGDDGSAAGFLDGLKGIGSPLTLVMADRPAPVAVVGITQDGSAVTARLRRAATDATADGRLRLADRRGHVLDERPFAFAAGASEAEIRFDLPLEIRNDVFRAEVVGGNSAVGVHLLDERWRRRSVVIVGAAGGDQAQPLIAPDYFLDKALTPFAEVSRAAEASLAEALTAAVARHPAAILVTDVGRFGADELRLTRAFMAEGGVLIRFAGPRLAAADDPSLPVPLRRGDRVLGGALSWSKPQTLAAFSDPGPFAGLTPPGDVTVTRQVLAEPGVDLTAKTWASLADGTPLVTGTAIGTGWQVLFHVTADSRWSNLPISGSFVEMLRALVALGNGGDRPASGSGVLAPLNLLDGFGRLAAPVAGVSGIREADIDAVRPSLSSPPGLYGSDDGFRAVNAMRDDMPYRPFEGSGLRRLALVGDGEVDLSSAAFGIALVLLMIDALAVMALGGAFRRVAVMTLALFALALPTPDARADDARLVEALSATRLAYVETGLADVDTTSRAGLSALSHFIASHSSLEPGEPMAVDPARDELSVFPLIYWPVDAAAPMPDAAAMSRIEAFMKEGGSVLFDSRDDAGFEVSGAARSPNADRLAEMLAMIDVPPLEPVPADHVLTKAFYLLDRFVGRSDASPLWVEASDEGEATDGDRPVRAGDGVSPILITGNDLAGAWATDDTGAFLNPLVPDAPRQREFAFRAGVNIVMYVLTGNYKADQVHVPALLERLGR